LSVLSSLRLRLLFPVYLPGRSWAQLFVLGGCEFVRSALFLAVLSAILQQRLHIYSVFTLGWLLGLLFGADTLLRSPSGWIVDHWGSLPTSLGASLVVLGGLWIVSFSSALSFIAVGVMLIGAGLAPVWTSVISGVTGRAGPEYQARALSAVFTAWLLGGGIGTLLSLYVLHRLPLEKTIEMLWGANMLAVFAAALAMGNRISEAKGALRSPYRAATRQPYLRRVGQALAAARALVPGLFLQTFILALVLAVMERYATQQLGWAAQDVIWLLLGGGGLALLLLHPVARLVDRYGPRPFLCAGFFAAAGPLAAIAFVRQPLQAALIAGLLGGAYALILTSWNTLLARAMPSDRRGGLWGVFTTLEGLGAACGPPVAGLLWEHVSPSAPFLLGGATLLLIAFVYTIFPIDRPLSG